MSDTLPSSRSKGSALPEVVAGAAAPTRNRWTVLAEATPLVAVVLIVALLGSLVWLADRREREEAGDNLIRDALWVEQALRFQIDAGRDALDRLALDMTATPQSEATVAARLRALVATHPEISAVEWRDDGGLIRVAVPPDGGGRVAVPPDGGRRVAMPPSSDNTAGRPRIQPSRGFGVAHVVPGQGAIADLTLPIFSDGVRVGVLTAHLALDRLLTLHVPWWISQNSQVALVDRDGAELARKSALAPGAGAARHDIDFDPPLPGVVLAIVAHHGPSNLTRNLLGAGIIGLAGVAVVSLFGLMRHYRRRLAAEQSLGEAQALRRAMEESLTVGMRARDLDERIIYVNPAFCRMVGRRAEELVGRTPPLPYWLPELVQETLARHQALGETELTPLSFETRFRRADGTVFDVLVYEAPLIDAGGVHRGWMGSIIDITARKRAEELERLQTEKMTRTGRLISMGEMASTISHELNQPLAAIASYAAGCLHLIKAGKPPSDLVGALEKLDAQAQRAGQVIRRVHDFVRKREPTFGAVDIASVIGELAGFVRPDARKAGVEIELELADAPLWVRADHILLEQVLLNLMRNGMEAMASRRRGERTLTISAHRVDDEIVVSVADRGTGIAEDVAGRLFTPFFSTKPEGMGMGLAICRSIVERHQGRLEFTARAGGGTVFTVTLPADHGEHGA